MEDWNIFLSGEMAPHGMNSQILICFGGNEEDVLNAENNEEYFIFLAFIKLAFKMLNLPKVLTERERSRGKSCHVFSLRKLQRRTNRISLKNLLENLYTTLKSNGTVTPIRDWDRQIIYNFSIKLAKCLQEEPEQCKVVDHYKPEFFSGLIFTIAQGFYSLVAGESSHPKSCRPKPESCCPKF